jgi:DNA-directed RNA polymerase subunit L
MEVNVLMNESNEISFELIGADQSITQLIVERLNKDKSVTFAAAKVAHPLVANPTVILKTKGKKAKDVLIKTLKEIKEELNDFRDKFEDISG